MTWEEAVDLVVAHTRHEPYRANCAEEHPQHALWRARMVARAEALAGKPVPEYPPLAKQAANAVAAAGRVVAAVARGDPVRVPDEVQQARLAICLPCEFNGARPAGVHCTKCGCGGMKLWLATERCPVGKWEEHRNGPTDG